MARYDNRTVSDDAHSYYVFDDLRFQQNPGRSHRGSFGIFYYDTLDDAIKKLQEIPEDMTPALGMHLSKMSELDLIHRREGEYILVSDYQNFSHWRTDPVVRNSVNDLCNRLQVDWCMDSKCFKGTILIPHERGFHRIPDKGISDKNLLPKTPRYSQSTPDPTTAVNEVFSPQQGWLPYTTASKAAEAFGFNDPNLLKVQQFNIRYTDIQGNLGQRDVSPQEMQLLMERWKFQHSDPHIAAEIAKRTAAELNDFLFSSSLSEQAQATSTKEVSASRFAADILAGDTKDIVHLLQSIRDDATQPDAVIAQAHIFLARIEGLHNTSRKQSLTQIIQAADSRASAPDQSSTLSELAR